MKYATRGAATTKTGPNDAWHVVWALGVLFFVLFKINQSFIDSINYIHDREGRDDDNGPKRCQMRRLGPR